MNREEKGAFPHGTRRGEGLWVLIKDILSPIIPRASVVAQSCPTLGLLVWHLPWDDVTAILPSGFVVTSPLEAGSWHPPHLS